MVKFRITPFQRTMSTTPPDHFLNVAFPRRFLRRKFTQKLNEALCFSSHDGNVKSISICPHTITTKKDQEIKKKDKKEKGREKGQGSHYRSNSLFRARPSVSSSPPRISHSALLYTSVTSMIAKSPPLAEAPCCEPARKRAVAPPANNSAAASQLAALM